MSNTEKNAPADEQGVSVTQNAAGRDQASAAGAKAAPPPPSASAGSHSAPGAPSVQVSQAAAPAQAEAAPPAPTAQAAGRPSGAAHPSLVVEPSDVDFDPPLIQCLAMLFRLHDRPMSTKLLISFLPAAEGMLRPAAAVRAAREAGMQASIMRRNLDQISPLTLPCILLLKEDRCCVLTRVGQDDVDVMFPETGLVAQTLPREEVAQEYIGYAFFGKPAPKLDKRASEIKLLKAKRWFWDTLLYYLPIYRHVVGASIVVNMLALVGPLFFMNVYDRVVPNKATDTLWVLAVGITTAYLFDFLLRNLRSYFVDAAGKSADVILASRLMHHLLGLRLDAKPDSTGSLANNLREFESLRDFFGSTTLLALVDLPFLFIFLAIIGLLGGPLVIIPLLAIPIVVCGGMFLQLPMQR
ncbi:MAG: type I secretion system permease/ATPase, partial [Deltaproteobacteria bacterium]|nr:type I secretion system permease/ATPase [Deltaproteobacteria bacterium]